MSEPVVKIVLDWSNIAEMFIGATLGYLLASWIWERLQLRKMARYAAKVEPITTVIPLEVCPECKRAKAVKLTQERSTADVEEGK